MIVRINVKQSLKVLTSVIRSALVVSSQMTTIYQAPSVSLFLFHPGSFRENLNTGIQVVVVAVTGSNGKG